MWVGCNERNDLSVAFFLTLPYFHLSSCISFPFPTQFNTWRIIRFVNVEKYHVMGLDVYEIHNALTVAYLDY